MRRVFSLIVDNSAGVLSRVSGLFSRRGYNIDSLTVGETADPRFSRMTVVSIGDEDTLDQIVKQLRKREIIMIKVKADASQRQDIAALCDIFRATIVDVAKDCLTVMLTGDNSKLEALSNLLSDYEVLELARTGLTALSRGSDDVVVFN